MYLLLGVKYLEPKTNHYFKYQNYFMGTYNYDDPFGCTTRNIPGVRRPKAQCIFPFKYNGITEHKCLQSPAWCSTKVDDESGAHIGGWGRNRGYCEDNCNLKIGKKNFH